MQVNLQLILLRCFMANDGAPGGGTPLSTLAISNKRVQRLTGESHQQ